ncbi:AtpZ/AtpI family protein [Formosa haliotis]|uniref:AtpZ/AtpI family protein n=1 Tax=Formosa haliotis TaxID=1555194 RepID=UPI000826689D|nr:AtpZ/AtpI family protein [Formosa haliotis]
MKEQQKKQLNNYIKFSGMAFQMIAIIGVLTFIGVWLDGKFPNQYSAYTVIFSLIGVIGAIYQIIKQVTNMNKKD